MPVYTEKLREMRGVRLSLRFRIGCGRVQHFGEMMGTSPEHLIISSSIPLRIGARLTILMQLPPAISRDPYGELEVCGRVVSESVLPSRKFGYQVDLDPQS